MSEVQAVVAGLKQVVAGQQRLSQQLHDIHEMLRLLAAQGEEAARRQARIDRAAAGDRAPTAGG